MGRLTTHVLDTANGRPGSGIEISLYAVDSGRSLIASFVTNDDGRTELPLLDESEFRTGTYELVFSVGEYFRSLSTNGDFTPFLEDVVVRFTAAKDEHFHVPLLVSPWSYSTYRGS